jgi:hypothetical protein
MTCETGGDMMTHVRTNDIYMMGRNTHIYILHKIIFNML